MTADELKKLTDVLEAAGFTVTSIDLGALLAHIDAVERRHRPLIVQYHRLAS
jgi:hypothetical protein